MVVSTATGFRVGTPSIYGSAGSERFGVNNAILKEYSEPAIRDLLSSRTPLLKMLQPMDRFELKGQYGVIPLRIGRNEGIGSIAEGGALPDPMTQRYDRATYGLTYTYARIKFTGPSVDATDSKAGSFLEVMDSETTGVVQDVARDMNRQLFGDGSGRLCQILGGNGTTDDHGDVSNPGGFSNIGPGTQYLREGMRVAIIDNAAGGATIRAIRTIKTVNRASNSVTFEQPNVTWPAFGSGITNYLVRASNTTTSSLGDTAWMNEPWGLAAICSDVNPFRDLAHATTYLGQLNRNNVPVWRSAKVANNGNPTNFYPLYLQRLLDVLSESSDGNVGVFFMSYNMRLTYLDALQPARSYQNTMSFDGGFETLQYSGRPCIPDRDATRGRIYGLDRDVIGWAMGKDLQFMDLDGSVLQRMLDEDAYTATLFRYAQFITDAPNRLGFIDDLKDA